MAERPVLTDLNFQNTARIVGLQDPVAAQDAATKAYVDSAVEGLAWKDSARVATQANTNLASPGATIDGVTMALNDRVLVRNQTAPAENGIYVWNGASTAMTRAPDANTFPELEQATVTVEEGTSAGTTFRQTVVNGTLGATGVTFATFGTSAPSASESTAGIAEIATQGETDSGTDDARFVTPLKLANSPFRARRFAQTFGDASNTSYTITHNLNSQDVQVAVRQAAGTFDEVLTEVEFTSVNSVTIRLNAAPGVNALRAIVTG